MKQQNYPAGQPRRQTPSPQGQQVPPRPQGQPAQKPAGQRPPAAPRRTSPAQRGGGLTPHKERQQVELYKLPENRNSFGDELDESTAYLRNVILYVVVAAIALVLLVYLIRHVARTVTKEVELLPAARTAVTLSADAEMLLFRDETVLRAQQGLSSVPAVRDGSHIAAGVTVARMYDSASPDVVAELEVLDAQLETLNKLKESTNSIRDIKAVDSSIYEIMHSVAAAGRSGDCSAVSSLRGRLISALNRRSVVLDSFSDMDKAIRELTLRRERVVDALGVCRQTVYAQKGGYYYSEADGYEATHTASAALSMSPENFAVFFDAEPETLNGTAGKIAAGYLWYSACVIPSDKAESLEQGGVYDVTFPYNNNARLSLKLERRVEYVDAEGAKTMLVFSCGTLPDSFLFTRKQPAVIVLQEYTGFRVPVSALRVVDGRDAVYVLNGSTVEVRYVSELYREEGYVLLADYQPAVRRRVTPGGDAERYTPVRIADGPLPSAMLMPLDRRGYWAMRYKLASPANWLRLNDVIIITGKELWPGKMLT